MTEYVGNNQEQEMFSPGRAFMGILMGIGAITGLWLLSGLVEMFAKIFG